MQMHDVLPEELVAKIFDSMSTKHRARVAVVCKAWRNISLRTCSSASLKFASLEELQAIGAWLNMLAHSHPDTLQALQVHWQGSRLLHPAPGSLHLKRFINLKTLDLKQPNNNWWGTTPKTIQGLAALTNLETLVVSFSPATQEATGGGGRIPDRSISLEPFANFKKLRSLSITLHPCRGWESGWQLSLSPKFGDLQKLTHLTLLGLKKVNVDTTFQKLIRQLQSLDFSTRECMSEVLPALQLTALKFWSLHTHQLPLQPSKSFRQLTFNGTSLPDNLAQHSPGITKLCFGEAINGVHISQVEQLCALQNLRKLRIFGLDHVDKSTTLDAFTCFGRLESLQLTLSGPAELHYSFPEAFKAMERLTVLKIDLLQHCALHYEGGLEHFGALKVFNMEAANLAVPIHSTSLETLHISCTALPSTSGICYIGDLPALRALRLKIVMSLPEMCCIIDKLKSLTNLTELSLEKRMVQPWPYAYTGDPQELHLGPLHSETSGFMETLLKRLSNIKGLDVLQFASVNDDVSLTRALLPRVKHLRIACRGLAVCDSCMPWQETSLQLMFLKASNYTHQLMQACHDVTLTESKSDITPYFTARKYDQGEIQHEFGDVVWVECWESSLEDNHRQFQPRVMN